MDKCPISKCIFVYLHNCYSVFRLFLGMIRKRIPKCDKITFNGETDKKIMQVSKLSLWVNWLVEITTVTSPAPARLTQCYTDTLFTILNLVPAENTRLDLTLTSYMYVSLFRTSATCIRILLKCVRIFVKRKSYMQTNKYNQKLRSVIFMKKYKFFLLLFLQP